MCALPIFNKNNSNNRGNNHSNNTKSFKQQKHRVDKPKEVPINHSIKGPLFDKSKLTPVWKINRKIGPGLINGQNTCFLNSVLECLTYTPPLAQYLLKEEHKKSCRMTGYCALCSMELHTRRCFKDPKSFVNGAAILPGYFTSNLKALSKTLRLGRQEDAHEFYMFLLSAFQKSSIAGLGKLPPKVEETALIYQIFGGKLRSQLKCFGCKATSNNFEACLDLSVDLSNADTVEKTLDNYIKVDRIEGYRCDSCKQIVKAGKQMTINEAPMMLTVHLKRFAFDLQRGYMRKIGTAVKYNETLDIAPYMSKDKRVSEASYNLYAVLVHLGYGCDSGHYYAYVKAPNGQWYRMDDEDVQAVSLKEVLSQNAYMLFYQQDNLVVADQPVKKQQQISEPPVVMQPPPPVAAKKVLVDPSLPKKEKKKVVMEPEIKADHPDLWVMQSSDKPCRSLRGNLSPPTYGAAVSDPSSWESTSTAEFKRKQKLRRRRVFKKNLESRKRPWSVGTL